ncbi:MAG: cell division protein FtsA [Verrucomicrobia bacterium]|nr:cell division protein FtsA [Verrucomicrobiota bacterium]
MALDPIVALEIGTSKVVALVGEMRDDGHIMITGIGEAPSSGVRKGEIIDRENAAACVRSVIAMAEDTGKVSISEVHLAVSGGHIQSLVNSGETPVLNRDRRITNSDMEQVKEVAEAVSLPADRDIIHSIYQHFSIDGHEQVINPEGMLGSRLSVDMLVVHGIRNFVANTAQVVRGIPVEVCDVAFSGLCSALAVLTPQQKQSGAIVVDLGGGTTDYLAYADDVIASTGAIGVGGDHVTNDIMIAFNIPLSQAERIKREAGNAVVDPAVAGHRVTIPAEVGFPGRTVGMKALHTVMNARLDETLRIIRKRIEVNTTLHKIGAGVVLTGGGARLKGITTLAERVFGLPCFIGMPRNVSGLVTVSEGPEYATCSGLVEYGFRKVDDSGRRPRVFQMLRKIFGG